MSKTSKSPQERLYLYETLGMLVLCIGALLFLALVTDEFQHQGLDRRYLDGMSEVPNLLRAPGAVAAGGLAIAFGDAAHVLYALLFVWGLMLMAHRPLDRLFSRLTGLLVLLFAVAALLQLDLAAGNSNPLPGGLVGAFLADQFLAPYFGIISANVVGFTLVIIGILLATDFLFVHVLLVLRRFLIHLFRGHLVLFESGRAFLESRREAAEARAERIARAEAEARAAAPEPRPAEQLQLEGGLERMTVRNAQREEAPVEMELPFDAVPEVEEPASPSAGAQPEGALHAVADLDDTPPKQQELPDSEPAAEPAPPRAKRRRKPRRKAPVTEALPPDYEYPRVYSKPDIKMLDEAEQRVIPNLDEKLRSTGKLLEDTLDTFGIEANVTDITRGPTITRFELQPAPGVKVSRFQALSDDIALALKAHRVRVEAPIPGKSRVGIEVPNMERDQVLIRELLESPAFRRGKGHLKLALGKDIAGTVKIADLATMPHLLVAGATGSGKTVCVKSLLASLLFQHTPDEMQLMLIDPKMVELSVFNDIPHLITPVVVDPKKASTALNWLISEMEERYRLFAELRTRNIEVYNESVENGEIEMEPVEGEEEAAPVHVIRKLPYIVCIIDELADLMMLARAEVEDAIGRLAQLARAVGIHLIIATQRPSVDVLTGVIKANFPARVSFQVSSRVDSRCILDEIGAERLIGLGDMLYLPAGQAKPHRLQGAFVSDEEMSSLISYLKTQAPPQYKDEIENFGKGNDTFDEAMDEEDPLLDEAIRVVLDTKQASISMVQRRLRVGYTRAARLIDMMEMRGIVGPHEGSKAREILVDAPPEDEVA